ncbi:MAG TPA: cytosine permease [Candidatus Limnocylindrales bacterium]|jgi:NCS1 family nucleobase:cation symporter-1|nr:cytosine permease [Candidatus Limnocylindrales bacterium]
MTAGAITREGRPTHEGDLTIEVHGFDPIPETARYGSVRRLFTVWFTPNLVPAAFFVGTLAAAPFLKVGFVTGLLAILVGNLIGSALVGALSTMGPATGMAQMPVARLAFGKSIVLPGFLNWLSCIGWDGVNNVFGAAAITLLTGLPFPISLLIVVLAQAALGVIGYEAIHTFEKYMAIVLGVMFAVLTVAIFIGGQASTARVDGVTGLDQVGAFVLFAAISASFVLAWGLYASDYSRYLPVDTPRSQIFWYTVAGLTLSAGWIEVLGLLVADKSTGPAVDTINTILGGGLLGALAMIAIAIGTVAVNAMNDYTGSLSLLAAGVKVRRVYSAIVVAVLGFFFTLYLNAGELQLKFESYLLFILYWVTPWAGVILADWLLRGAPRRLDVRWLTDFGRLPSGVLALVAMIIGFVVSLPFQTSSFGDEIAKATGLPINAWAPALHFADIAFIVGFVVSAAIYWLSVRFGVGEPGREDAAAAA